MSRVQDDEKIGKFKETLPKLEEWYKTVQGGSQWLSGTENPNYLDIYCFTLMERMVQWRGTEWDEGYKKLECETLCPSVVKHVDDMLAHPVLGKGQQDQEFYKAHISKWNALPQGEKPPLWVPLD